jgi:predicted fused transcriptional regulator/phosphomethylpyrimidine kinase
MKEIISKDGVVKCVSNVPHPPEVIKALKKAGYKIKTVSDSK